MPAVALEFSSAARVPAEAANIASCSVHDEYRRMMMLQE